MSWFGHVQRMTCDRMFKQLYECKPTSTRQAGRPKIIQENDIRQDFRIMEKAIGQNAYTIRFNGRKQMTRPKISNKEVVAPDEENEQEADMKLHRINSENNCGLKNIILPPNLKSLLLK